MPARDLLHLNAIIVKFLGKQLIVELLIAIFFDNKIP